MSNLIERQAAINAINHICPVDTEYDCTLLDRVDVRCVLTDLPSAQPESDWSYDEDEKEITIVVPKDVYESAESIFLTVGYEGSLGLRGKIYSLTQHVGRRLDGQ